MKGIPDPRSPVESEYEEKREEVECERPIGADYIRDGQQVEEVDGKQQQEEDPQLNVVSLLLSYTPGLCSHRIRRIIV